MGEHISQGKNSLIHVTGKDYKILKKEEMSNDGKFGIHSDEETLDQTFSAGRTISLANWEYARVTCGIKVGLPIDCTVEYRDLVHNKCVESIEEILDREEASVKGIDKVCKSIDLKDIGIKVKIWLDYGLTFKLKTGGDSHKVDISASRVLTDGSDFESQLSDLADEIGKRIGEYKKEVLGDGDSNIDIGF